MTRVPGAFVIFFADTQTAILTTAPTWMVALVLDVTEPFTPKAVLPVGHVAAVVVKVDVYTVVVPLAHATVPPVGRKLEIVPDPPVAAKVQPLRGPVSFLLAERCLQETVGLAELPVAADAVVAPAMAARGTSPSSATSPTDVDTREFIICPNLAVATASHRGARGMITGTIGWCPGARQSLSPDDGPRHARGPLDHLPSACPNRRPGQKHDQPRRRAPNGRDRRVGAPRPEPAGPDQLTVSVKPWNFLSVGDPA